jgi:peptidoglycan hydrolase-like protein with peptidoglycan-binding domain
VLANALFLQPVPHPAPLFGEEPKPAPAPAKPVAVKKSVPAAPAPLTSATPVPIPRPEAAAAPRGRSELLLDIQRELANRGYYDGTVDGLPGPRTTQAIRDFEQAQGLKQTGEPSDAVLAHIFKARSRKKDTTGSVAPEVRASTRVLAVQRVLARLGYGPVKLTGLSDTATRNAIEQFERDRGLAKSGEINDRLVTELAKVTGAPVE